MLSTALVIAWLCLPAAAWFLNFCTGKKIHGLLLYFIAAFVGYVALVGAVAVKNAELDAEIKRFDLDGDGGYSDDELTPEAEKALDEWASDTGRQFAPIVGIPFTIVWYGLVMGCLFCFEWIIRSLFFRSGSTEDIESNLANQTTEPPPPEDGNPYRAPKR